jgi:hypothetical protein
MNEIDPHGRANVVQSAMPALWNPNAAASWSLLFSPIFGAILHMKNWQAMGEPQRAAASRSWAMGSTAFFVLLTIMAVILPDSKVVDALSRLGAVALLIAWYYANGKPQQAFVLARFGKHYPRRGWSKPLLLAVLAIVGYLAALFVVGLVAGLLVEGI